MSLAIIPLSAVLAAESILAPALNEQKRYVVGFWFNRDLKTVAMIHKLHPAWQKGKLNGIGGKVESWETADMAMRREFQEETGVATPEGYWIRFGMLEFPDAIVHCYVAVRETSFGQDIESKTDEDVSWCSVSKLIEQPDYINTINNIPALLTLALQYLEHRDTLKANERA